MIASRRTFFAATAGMTLARSTVLGANERIRLGVIGCGVRGKNLIGNLPDDVRVTAICDCAQTRMADTLNPTRGFATTLAGFREREAHRVASYQDYRKLLDAEKLEGVLIAAPDHHHVPAATLACQAGLDVYIEKPLSLRLNEGRQLIDVANQQKRVVQVGSQQRSMEMNVIGCELIREGILGKIHRVDLPAYPGPMRMEELQRPSFLPLPSSGIPAPHSIDWRLFLGATDPVSYDPRWWMKEDFKIGGLLWRGWDLFRNFSGHLMTNWGAHSVDMVQLALGRDQTGPVSAVARRPEDVGELAKNWSAKTPPPLTSHLGNEDERRFWPLEMRYADGVELHFRMGSDSITFHGEKGQMKMRRNFFSVDPPELLRHPPDPALTEKWQGESHIAKPHIENWIACMRSRAVPVAPLEVGHRTVTICQLANLARERNEPIYWDPVSEKLVEQPSEAGLR